MSHWTLNDIPWQEFNAAKVTPAEIALVKAASLVEYNGNDYARYLCEVFAGDTEFQQAALTWAEEEVQHGKALRGWAELADPTFDFEKSFRIFTEGYKIPLEVSASVRGSHTGELIARCVVETGTSSYYSALKESTGEPVLQNICARIAADEFRHYKLFYTHLKRYLKKENIRFVRRFIVAMGRIAESEDDELSYAYFAANIADNSQPYSRKYYGNLYLSKAYRIYRKHHIELMIAMVMKAVGLKPNGKIHKILNLVAWNVMQLRSRRLDRSLPAAA